MILRHFVHQPNPATEILLCPTSTSFIDSKSRPFGSTVYNKDFRWKPACRPECIRTGSASGNRRNNPHPSQAFMMWRLPRDATRSPEYVTFPRKCPPSEEEIRKALTAQYHSTYRCDFMGRPQGPDHMNNAERRLDALHSRRHMSVCTDTEMRDNYRQPQERPELLGKLCHHTEPSVACHGIVPTVVQRHIRTQQKRSDVTTYDRFCGRKVSDVTHVIKSLLPQELQQLYKILPEEDRKTVQQILNKGSRPNSGHKGNKLPAVNSCSPEWISGWTGPL
ncbi:hypothetical protein Q5P01_009747 [Channa striata]|uniref:Testis-expressed protein 26 n=1 Tax=Channa striata TaxID=64152 RepID=A0AA88MWE7_CHASR|nr:hypothetical protein Q5P01_009747 [Channa striata]